MKRAAFRVTAGHGWRAGPVVALVAVALCGCEAPRDAVRLTCSGTGISGLARRHDCKVALADVERPTSTWIALDTRRQRVHVKAHFTVRRGTVKIVVKGGAGDAREIVASPGAPGVLEDTLKLQRAKRGFHLGFHPDGEAAGLEGALTYQAR